MNANRSTCPPGACKDYVHARSRVTSKARPWVSQTMCDLTCQNNGVCPCSCFTSCSCLGAEPGVPGRRRSAGARAGCSDAATAAAASQMRACDPIAAAATATAVVAAAAAAVISSLIFSARLSPGSTVWAAACRSARPQTPPRRGALQSAPSGRVAPARAGGRRMGVRLPIATRRERGARGRGAVPVLSPTRWAERARVVTRTSAVAGEAKASALEMEPRRYDATDTVLPPSAGDPLQYTSRTPRRRSAPTDAVDRRCRSRRSRRRSRRRRNASVRRPSRISRDGRRPNGERCRRYCVSSRVPLRVLLKDESAARLTPRRPPSPRRRGGLRPRRSASTTRT
eukprot:362818-Chlamydomonas_euryale.AAC.2